MLLRYVTAYVTVIIYVYVICVTAMNRIIAAAEERVTPQDAAERKHHPDEHAAGLDRFDGVLRTGRNEPTGWRALHGR